MVDIAGSTPAVFNSLLVQMDKCATAVMCKYINHNNFYDTTVTLSNIVLSNIINNLFFQNIQIENYNPKLWNILSL